MNQHDDTTTRRHDDMTISIKRRVASQCSQTTNSFIYLSYFIYRTRIIVRDYSVDDI